MIEVLVKEKTKYKVYTLSTDADAYGLNEETL